MHKSLLVASGKLWKAESAAGMPTPESLHLVMEKESCLVMSCNRDMHFILAESLPSPNCC